MDLWSLFSSFGDWNWVIAAILLFSLELLVPGFYLMFFALAALIVAFLAFTFDISWQIQFILAGVISLMLVGAARVMGFGQDIESDKPLLNLRTKQYIGKSYVLVEPIEQGTGKIKVGDSVWLVNGPDLPKGQTVKVTDARGTKLIVEPVTN